MWEMMGYVGLAFACHVLRRARLGLPRPPMIEALLEKAMPGAVFIQSRRIEFSMLHNVKPIGPSMGFYAGREIPAFVVDEFGRRFAYAGVAPRKWNGVFDVDALAAGEFLVWPGLIYRRMGAKSSWWQSLLGTGYVGEKGQTWPSRLR